jgi:LysR family glycine cleavage system transcriptional activator
MKLPNLKPSGTLRFSHYDQVGQAALDGNGIAIGRTPQNARHLREGLLLPPLGAANRLKFGAYLALIAPRSIERPIVQKFLAWVRGGESQRKLNENIG